MFIKFVYLIYFQKFANEYYYLFMIKIRLNLKRFIKDLLDENNLYSYKYNIIHLQYAVCM